jgi:hypothetical protein
MQIDRSRQQSPKVLSSIQERPEPDANVTDRRNRHSLKQPFEMCLTDAGMRIDENDREDSNAWDAIRESLDSDSNVTAESKSHC